MLRGLMNRFTAKPGFGLLAEKPLDSVVRGRRGN